MDGRWDVDYGGAGRTGGGLVGRRGQQAVSTVGWGTGGWRFLSKCP